MIPKGRKECRAALEQKCNEVVIEEKKVVELDGLAKEKVKVKS